MDRVEQAIKEVLDGNREAYRVVVEEYESSIRLLLAGLLPSRDLVDDLTQEVFIHAYLKLCDYSPGTNFRAWLRTVARNKGLNARRTWFRRHNRFQAVEELDDMLGQEIEAEASTLAEHAGNALWTCMAKLADNARSVTQAYYLHEHSSSQIAAENGRTTAWVRLVLHRSRIALAKCLAEERPNHA